MNLNQGKLQQNLSYLLCNTELNSKKSKIKLNQDQMRSLQLGFTKIQKKLQDHVCYCFCKLKHHIKSLKNRDLIYQAIFKFSSFKSDNSHSINKLEIKSTQKEKNSGHQKIKSPQNKVSIKKNEKQSLKKYGNHVEIPKKPQSVNLQPNIKFSYIYDSVKRRDSFNGKNFTVSSVKDDKQAQQQNTRHGELTNKTDNQSRAKRVENFLFADKRANNIDTQTYLVKAINRKTKAGKIIWHMRVPLVTTEQLKDFQFFKEGSKNNELLFGDLETKCKNQPALHNFNSDLDLSKIKSSQQKLFSNENQCKYCDSISRAKKLVSMHSAKTSTNESSLC